MLRLIVSYDEFRENDPWVHIAEVGTPDKAVSISIDDPLAYKSAHSGGRQQAAADIV